MQYKLDRFALQAQQLAAQQALQAQYALGITPVQQQQQGSGEEGGESGNDDASGGQDIPPKFQGKTPTLDDLIKLDKTLNSERDRASNFEKELKTLKRQLEAFSGVDPEAAKRAQQILKEQEEWEQQKSRIMAELDESYQPKIKQLQEQATAAEQRLYDYQRDVLLEREASKAGNFPGEFEPIASALRQRVRFDPQNGNVQVMGKDGKPMYVKGEPATVAQLIDELKSEQLWFARHFKSKDVNGAGINGNATDATYEPGFNDLSDWEQVKRMRAQQMGR